MRIRLFGQLGFEDAGDVWRELRGLKKRRTRLSGLDVDCAELEGIDGGSAAVLLYARERLRRQGLDVRFIDVPPKVAAVLEMYEEHRPKGGVHRRRASGVLDQIGRAALVYVREVQLALSFVGEFVLSARRVFRAPRSVNWREVPRVMEQAGADAVPIAMLINFLVGLVMAFQASTQLKRFGANLLVADLIGISVTRELSPLMTAIVVSGRSGAAFAAEFGAMRVNEEIDALRTMGLSVMRFLVLPRVIGLVLAVPLLVLLTDVIGVLGGMVVGVYALDLTAVAYLKEVHKVLRPWDVYSGLIKSGIFAAAIGLIASQQGLAAEGGAEGVGRRTTASVVVTLFMLILIDALFTIAFKVVGR